MKFVILAATVGYVFGAVGDDCGTLAGGDTPCGDTTNNYCNLAADSSEGTDAANGLCAAKIAAGAACVADGDCVSGDCDASTCRLADAATCTANGECLDASYCKDTDGAGTLACAAKEAAGATCVATTDCAADVCQAGCGTKTCGTNANADGALGGCCDANTAVTADANYCLANIVTAKVADAGTCSVAGAGAECASGGCTATAATDDDADIGTCDATVTAPAAGETGGACRAVIAQADAVTACGTDLTCDTATSTFCQDSAGAPAAIDADAAAGTLGGACTADAVNAQTACDGTDVCNETVCGAATEAPAGDDEDSAALFYGLSMVTGAIAYLL